VNQVPHRRIAVPNQSPGEERLLAMVAALASELAVVRERLDTVERLAEAGGVFQPGAVEAFVPTAEQVTHRDGLRQRLIGKIFRPVRDALASAAAGEPR
jgi:hypothetical protein